MKVFLGWSGDRSKALAEAIHAWLPLVLHYVQPWMSQADIAAGERWSPEISKELEESNFGILSLTHENLSEPWIQFEAGCLSKSVQEGKVIPLLLGLEISAVKPPLAQFQAKKADKVGVQDVVDAINKGASNPTDDGRLKELFGALWPKLEEKVTAIPDHDGSAKPMRPEKEILEELVVSIRSVESRLSRMEEIADEQKYARGPRRHRPIHPMMLEDLTEMAGFGPGDPTALLVLAGALRDDFPPLYELTMDAFRAYTAGNLDQAEHNLHRMERLSEVISHGSFADEFVRGSKDLHMFLRELPRVVHQISSRLVNRPLLVARRVDQKKNDPPAEMRDAHASE